MTEQNWQEIAKIFEDAKAEAVLKPNAARELVEHCKAKPLVSRNNSSFEYAKGASVKDIHDWINDLESLVADAEAVAP